MRKIEDGPGDFYKSLTYNGGQLLSKKRKKKLMPIATEKTIQISREFEPSINRRKVSVGISTIINAGQ